MRTRGWAGLVVCTALGALAGCGEDAEPEGEPMPADIETIQERAAASMGDVTSARFHIERTGAPVFIDQFESIALDQLDGRFTAPASADAVLEVTIDNSLSTKLGAIALDDEVYLSNPVTGTFEPLDPSIDLDPSKFFDPKGAWRPLLASLTDAELIGEEERNGGTRYHIRGTATAEQMEAITAGLVEQELPIDFWVRRDNGLVSAAEFTTEIDGETTEWVLELEDYGDEFDIQPPDLDG